MSSPSGLNEERISAIGARFGVKPEQIVAIAGGEANQTWLLGSRLVLRIPRDEGQATADLRKEAIVIPAARAVGVLTPALVAFDDTRSVLPTPFMVLDRCHGADLAHHTGGDEGHAHVGVMKETGRQLARLHHITLAAAEWSSAAPIDHDDADPRLTLERLADAGLLDAGNARWIGAWFDLLSPWLPARQDLVLIHGDVAPQNLMVAGEGNEDPAGVRLTGIIDWGDAAWADPAADFAKLRLENVHHALTGYLDGAEPDGERFTAWRARVLWRHLAWAIGRLEDPAPGPRARHWTAPPYSRLVHLARFFLDDPPEPWRSLAPRR